MSMPPPLGFHLVLRLQDDRVLAPSVAARRRLARVFMALAREAPVLAWRVVDTHVHVLVLADAAGVDALVARLRMRMARVHPGVPLLLSRRLPVRNQWHLAECFRYVLAQDAHHGVSADPLQEASAVLDILGLRVGCAPIALRVREHLPRVSRAELLEHLAVATLAPVGGTDALAEAACAAFALDTVTGRGADANAARHAAIHAAGDAPARVAAALGVTARCVQRVVSEHAALPDAAVRAVGLQMALRRARALPVSPFAGEIAEV